MEKKTNTPALRFREFSGEWQNKAIVDLSETTYGGGTPATVNPDYWNGDIPWIQSSDISEENLWEVIPRKHISKSAVKESAAKIIPANSIAIIVRVGVGKLAFLPFSYATSQDFLSLSDLKIDEYFGTCAIWKRLQADLSKVQGTSIKGVTKEELLAKKVAVPVTEKEAKKIGELAYIFDQNIIHRQRKIADLERFRQAMLTKLFPAEGASEPALRFRGFSGEWEILKLKELADIQTGPFGSQLHKEDYVQNGTPIVTVEHLGEKFFTEQNLPRVSDEDKKRLQKYTLHEGDIVFSRVGAIDRSSYVDEIHDGWLFSGRCLRVRPGRKVYPLYLYYYLQLASVKNFIYSIAVGGTMPSLNTLILGQVDIMVPNVVAQKKIGDFFAHLDDILSLQKEKLDKLRLLKAALLDRLFV